MRHDSAIVAVLHFVEIVLENVGILMAAKAGKWQVGVL